MKSNGTLLAERYDRLIKHGEVPYQANRRALKAFDIFGEDEEGHQELLVMLEGIDIFIGDLEAFEHDTETVAKQAVAGFR